MTDLHKTIEPVAWVVVGNGKFGEFKLGDQFTKLCVDYWNHRGYESFPLYTAPPSVLIAEAVEKEREACAKIGEDFDKERPQSNYGRCIAVAIRARGQK